LKTPESMIRALEEFEPFEDENETTGRLYDVLEGLEAIPNAHLVVPAMLALLERYPFAEFGSPGPIVHTLEALGGYEDNLKASLNRQPTDLTVWMVNRILNSDPSSKDREMWLTELRSASLHPKAPDQVKKAALAFLHYQAFR
jgi:hypothetical protein